MLRKGKNYTKFVLNLKKIIVFNIFVKSYICIQSLVQVQFRNYKRVFPLYFRNSFGISSIPPAFPGQRLSMTGVMFSRWILSDMGVSEVITFFNVWFNFEFTVDTFMCALYQIPFQASGNMYVAPTSCTNLKPCDQFNFQLVHMLGREMLCQTTGMLLTVNKSELENHKLVCI